MKVGDLVTWHGKCKMKPMFGVLLGLEYVTAQGPYFDGSGNKISEGYSYEEALVLWNGSSGPLSCHREDIVVHREGNKSK